MAAEVCSVCSKQGAKKCSRCKFQFYCSKECQKKDWKTHKSICREISNTTAQYESTGPTRGIGEGILSAKKDRYSQMLSMVSAMGVTQLVPEYHNEYKKLYPAERTNYEKLCDSWMMAKMLDETLFGNRVIDDSREYDHRDLLKRWQYFGLELVQFLSSNPNPRDIFSNRTITSYGAMKTPMGAYNTTIYQTMRNTPVLPSDFDFGNTYISIGFMDMLHLVLGSYSVTKDEASSQPMVFVEYNKSEVVIARSLVIYEMMLQGVSPESILQVWFSTGWNNKTFKDFKKMCEDLLKNVDSTVDERVRKLLNHWMVKDMGVKTVLPLWRQFVAEGQLEPLNNLRYEKDHTDYARYIFTGHIFGKNDKDYVHGNLTMFSLPNRFDNYQRQDESIFAAMSMRNIPYATSLLTSVTKRITKCLNTLVEHIRSKRIACNFI